MYLKYNTDTFYRHGNNRENPSTTRLISTRSKKGRITSKGDRMVCSESFPMKTVNYGTGETSKMDYQMVFGRITTKTVNYGSGTWFKNGLSDGLWEVFHENGQLTSKQNFKNGLSDGLW